MQHLWKTYKITNVEYDQMWTEQNGRCACTKEFAHPFQRSWRIGVKPEVDHEHKYDEEGNELSCTAADVRGLLCQRCNSLLGKMRDNMDILAGLLQHLEKYKNQNVVEDDWRPDDEVL